jgi:hypothetical protein
MARFNVAIISETVINEMTFTWYSQEYKSATGGDYSRDGYKIDGKRVSCAEYYRAKRIAETV